MQPRFGRDLSQVRVHTDSRAATSAAAVNALAYTSGTDVVFGAGRYRPGTEGGRGLIAHELTHVLQQRGNPAGPARSIIPVGDPREQEARVAERSIANGDRRLPPIREHASPQIARNDGGPVQAGASVGLVTMSCQSSTISFYTSNGIFSYPLTSCDLTDGDYTASVSVTGNNVDFDLGEDVPAGTRFEFAYRIEPGQPNPSAFFRSQTTVRIIVGDTAVAGSGAPTIVLEIPVTFVADPVGQVAAETPTGSAAAAPSAIDLSDVPGHPLTSAGLAGHVLATGDLSWLSSGAAARRVLSRHYWSPFVPSGGTVTLDRLLDELPRDLAPKIDGELAAGRPLSWLRRGFTEAELNSIPDLVRRLNSGGLGNLTPAEADILMRAANLHVGGSSPGAPFASYTRPTGTADLAFLSGRRYRVRVEVPGSAVLDVSQWNEFTTEASRRLYRELPNLSEAEFLVTADHRGRITSVQPLAGSPSSSFLLRHSNKIRWGGRGLFVVGLGLSAHRIAEVSPEERPVVIGEEAGGLAGGAAGTGLAVAGCVAFGIATGGVGLFFCGLAGGVVGGLAGSAAGGEIVRGLQESERSAPCPSCHAMQRQWEAQRAFGQIGNLDLPGTSLTAGASTSGPRSLSDEELTAIQQWLSEAR